MRFLPSRIAAILLAGVLATGPALALEESEKEEIGAFIREYLIANPEVMIEVQQALEAKQREEQAGRAGEAIAASQEALFEAPGDLVLGNPEGDVTIVEFFDYNCGYCKRAHADMLALIESDPELRFVLKEWPVLGPESLGAHRVSLSLRTVAPEQYAAFQDALLTFEGRADETTALQVAENLGVDVAAVKEGLDDPQIMADIQANYQIADAIGMSGTPSYVVGDEAVFGAMGAEVLAEKVANMRDCGRGTCP